MPAEPLTRDRPIIKGNAHSNMTCDVACTYENQLLARHLDPPYFRSLPDECMSRP